MIQAILYAFLIGGIIIVVKVILFDLKNLK